MEKEVFVEFPVTSECFKIIISLYSTHMTNCTIFQASHIFLNFFSWIFNYFLWRHSWTNANLNKCSNGMDFIFAPVFLKNCKKYKVRDSKQNYIVSKSIHNYLDSFSKIWPWVTKKRPNTWFYKIYKSQI